MEPELKGFKPVYESDELFEGAAEELTNGTEPGEDDE